MKTKTLWILAALALGCGTDDETGVLEVRLSGEEASREGYPVGTGDGVYGMGTVEAKDEGRDSSGGQRQHPDGRKQSGHGR